MTPDDELREMWRAWEHMPYPSDEYPPGGADFEGVDLAQTAGSVAAILDDWFTNGQLEASNEKMLPYALADLERAIPELTGHGSTYFGAALELLLRVSRERSR